MSAHVGTYQYMSTCADICQYADEVHVIGYQRCREWHHMLAHAGKWRHMWACPHVLIHASMPTGSKWLVPKVLRVMLHICTCRHMSARVSTRRHISVNVCMSSCTNTYQHVDNVQMIHFRGAGSDVTCWHVHICAARTKIPHKILWESHNKLLRISVVLPFLIVGIW